MDNLPNEILINIFQCLSQKDMLILSTVCTKWQSILFQSLFLNTLHIYSIHQLKEYVTMAKSKMSIGQHVNHLFFYTRRKVKQDLLIDIINAFPHLHSIEQMNTYIKPSKNTIRDHISSINHLELFPSWYNRYDEQWMNLLSKSQHKIKSLSLFLKPKLLVLDTNQKYFTPPVLYFTPISPIKGTIYEYSFYTDSECKIYNVKLPFLSSLTHLDIDCMNRDGDERMFESIHQSCPQLTSLTLTSFRMHTSEFYTNKVNDQSLKPNILVKTLLIGYLLNDLTCFEYLTLKYSHLESLTLFLGPEYNTHLSKSSYKSAIYHFITHFQYLKLLNISFGSEVYQNELWPHEEILEWLQQNPSQITHLRYPFYSKNKIWDNNNNMIRIHDQLESEIDPSSLYSNIIFQPQPVNYLNHLSSLSLGGKYSNALHTLCYFYLCHENTDSSHPLFHSIDELKLGDGHIGNIYMWLSAFPNLKVLKIDVEGRKYLTDYDLDEYDDQFYYTSLGLKFEDIYPFLKKRMEQQQQQQQQQIITHLKTSTISDMHYPSYKLKEITIRTCFVDFRKYGWNELFKRCPHLNTIFLNNINPWITSYADDTIRVPLQRINFDLSHLSLDLLSISNFKYEEYINDHGQLHLVDQLYIKESLLNHSFYVGSDSEIKNIPFATDNRPLFTLNINCKRIDDIVFYHKRVVT